MHYVRSYSYYLRIDKLISWFLKFDLDLACIYFDEPDHQGHTSGPDTQQYRDKVEFKKSLLTF